MNWNHLTPFGLLLISWTLASPGRAGDEAEPKPRLKSARIVVLAGEEQVRFVKAHNEARKAVGVDPVKWSAELGTYSEESLQAQKEAIIRAATLGWAELHLPIPDHRTETSYGENIAAWMGNRSRSAESAVASWLREKAAFDELNAADAYRVGDEAGKTRLNADGKERPVIVGHYTQIVWRTTTHVGAAKLEFELVDDQGESRTYAAVFCSYNPPGNRREAKPY